MTSTTVRRILWLAYPFPAVAPSHLTFPRSEAQSSTSMSVNGSGFANYIELAAVLVPQSKSESKLKQKLRWGCSFVPIPFSLGSYLGSSGDNGSTETMDPGLLLTDIASGATRNVRVAWMNSLYDHMRSSRLGKDVRVSVLHLNEIGLWDDCGFGWPHIVLFNAFIIQVVLAVYALNYDHHARDGLLILAGLLVRVLQGVYDWYFPLSKPPRMLKKDDKSRYYALHTGMTTRYILVISHEPESPHSSRYHLEDAAYTVSNVSRRTGAGKFCGMVLQLSGWIQGAACIVTSSNGFVVSLVMLLGTAVIECLAAFSDTLPTFSELPVAPPQNRALGWITAACQMAGGVSCGFVESILPDPEGKHKNYEWILKAMKGDISELERPELDDPDAEKIMDYAVGFRRRATGQAVASNDA
ncbi:hypothetical protein BD410DRAFT_794483 [Rickenella mellea]|uniref:Uncharacterized protein n=1 Tax=Rickenella mellea TaxID=50990 RepID=A0A4Y7PQK6_9AGAM|nr:hypothetical protein BD410DRAFT_794483 [Rickenella mellea]